MKMEAPAGRARARDCASGAGAQPAGETVTELPGRDWPIVTNVMAATTHAAKPPNQQRRRLAFLLRCLRRNDARTASRAGLGPPSAPLSSSTSLMLISLLPAR